MQGEIADPNLWSYQLKEEEVQKLNCSAEGNIVNSQSLLESDDVVWVNRTYPCSGELTLLGVHVL